MNKIYSCVLNKNYSEIEDIINELHEKTTYLIVIMGSFMWR